MHVSVQSRDERGRLGRAVSGQESGGARRRREDARRSRRTSERTRRGAKRGARGGWSATKSRPAANAPLLPLALLLRATREDANYERASERTYVRSVGRSVDRFSRTASAAAGFFIDNYNARASRLSISRKPIPPRAAVWTRSRFDEIPAVGDEGRRGLSSFASGLN